MTLSADSERACAGLDAGEYVAYLHPFVQVSTGQVIGGELLARWLHPERGVLGPGVFIDHLEQSQRLPELTDLMIATACSLTAGGRFVSLNLCRDDLADTKLLERIREPLQLHGADQTRLCLEIVESDMVPEASLRLVELNARGIQIAVDDFGAAYSSLARVIDLQVDIVKLDRSLVRGIHQRPRSQVVLRSFIDGMRELGTIVIAEGIELPEEVSMVASLGCDVIQGFVFGRPAPLDSVGEAFTSPEPLEPTAWQAECLT